MSDDRSWHIARARQENKEGYAERGTDQTEGTSDDD